MCLVATDETTKVGHEIHRFHDPNAAQMVLDEARKLVDTPMIVEFAPSDSPKGIGQWRIAAVEKPKCEGWFNLSQVMDRATQMALRKELRKHSPNHWLVKGIPEPLPEPSTLGRYRLQPFLYHQTATLVYKVAIGLFRGERLDIEREDDNCWYIQIPGVGNVPNFTMDGCLDMSIALAMADALAKFDPDNPLLTIWHLRPENRDKLSKYRYERW